MRYIYSFGSLLKDIRNKHNYYQKEMAGRLGISREYYCKLESEKALPSVKLFLKMCKLGNIKLPFNQDCRPDPEKEMCNMCSLLNKKQKESVKILMKNFL